ncbi:MAG: hypothetical protein NTV33_09550, partial [Coprothermobacterota bacterium]|nr:hypothetical protein [Coprothermobacterota bacterium]
TSRRRQSWGLVRLRSRLKALLVGKRTVVSRMAVSHVVIPFPPSILALDPLALSPWESVMEGGEKRGQEPVAQLLEYLLPPAPKPFTALPSVVE